MKRNSEAINAVPLLLLMLLACALDLLLGNRFLGYACDPVSLLVSFAISAAVSFGTSLLQRALIRTKPTERGKRTGELLLTSQARAQWIGQPAYLRSM